MISFNTVRTLYGVLGKQTLFMKQFLTNASHRVAFLHTSRIFWDGHPIEIKMPSLSPTMTEGTIVKWLKKEGDTISPGDVLCEIQTDKAVVGLETEEEGILEKILIPEDTKNIQLGEIIAIIIGEGGAEISESLLATTPTHNLDTEKRQEHHETNAKEDQTRLIGPSVKKLLEEYNIKINDIPTSGPHHNLLKGDVLNYIKNHNLKPSPQAVEKPKPAKPRSIQPVQKSAQIDIPTTPSITETAREMIQSKKTIPHGYMKTDCNMEKIFDYKKKFLKDGMEVTLNDFVVKSTITALKRVPKINAVRQNNQLKRLETINILLTDFNGGGNKTSVIKNAGSLSVQLISECIKSSQSTEPNSLESTNGTFKISNLGSFGISEFSEIISPTDVATMTVGGIRYTFEQDKPVKSLRITLSFDNSVIEDNEAGEFLEILKQCLENPLNIMSMG